MLFRPFQLIYYVPSRIYLIKYVMKPYSKNSQIFHSMMHNYHPIGKKPQNNRVTIKINVPIHRIQEQIELYQWRKANAAQVICCQWVKIEPFDEKNVSFTLTCTQKLLSLEEIKTIKGGNSLKNISKIFQSFCLLYQKFGPFEVNSKMIAYDAFFEPYVWINEDYSKNEYKRDHVSQQQFASNILFLLLKYDHKFQNNHILDYFCEIKGQGFHLTQIANLFKQFQQKEFLSKKSKIAMSASQGSTLSFSKQSRIKKRSNSKKEFKGLNTISNQTYHSFLKNNEKQRKFSIQRTASLTEIKGFTTNDFSNNHGSEIKINILKENDYDFSQQSRKGKDSFLPIRQELQISIDFENEQQMQRQEKVVELQHLDKFKKYLAKSIITGPHFK